jgi:hypothetical protein
VFFESYPVCGFVSGHPVSFPVRLMLAHLLWKK